MVVPAGYQSKYPYDPSGKIPSGEETVFPDPLIWLSFIAARTSTIRLGTGILIVPQRNPLVLAKELATLDFLSGGRMILGAGVGWLEEEFDALGIPFAGRGHRTEEAIRAMRTLWSRATGDLRGQHHQLFATAACGRSRWGAAFRSTSVGTAPPRPDELAEWATGSSPSASPTMSCPR